MAGIADSLNYGRFEFVDSDDEDYVEKSILKTALDPNSTSIATRNAAAHALAKKGELPARIGGAPSQIDKTLSATRLKMTDPDNNDLHIRPLAPHPSRP